VTVAARREVAVELGADHADGGVRAFRDAHHGAIDFDKTIL
jgi:hypothetical protein